MNWPTDIEFAFYATLFVLGLLGFGGLVGWLSGQKGGRR